MARKIIILENVPTPGHISFRYGLWAIVPTARQSFYTDAAKSTQVKDATAMELDDIRSGRVVERVEEQRWRAGTPIAQIKTALIDTFNAYQAEIDGKNDWGYYGTFWDGNTWTNKTTA